MQLILLSGGSGKRLWPLSNDIRSKQFIKIFKSGHGYESMLQRMYRQVHSIDMNIPITIATSISQVSAIQNQLGETVNISVEPCRRDTFPAIVLAASYLYDVCGVSRDEVVVICPVDPYVELDYFKALIALSNVVLRTESNLVLMGIEPNYPSEKYGYIIPENTDPISGVRSFKEKPSIDIAREYINHGALWNAGVFACKLGYLLDKGHELIDFTDYGDLYARYDTMPKISFDYAIVEKEAKICVLRYQGIWKDMGTWNTLTETMDTPILGKGSMDDTCCNVHVINELDVPVLCAGLKNVVVAVSADGILVSDKEQSSYIKPYVDAFHEPIMFAEKSWGSYRVLHKEHNSLVVLVVVRAGHHMSYHKHVWRDENWMVLSGCGYVKIDGIQHKVSVGDVLYLPKGSLHTVVAETELKLLEIQRGTNISESDKMEKPM